MGKKIKKLCISLLTLENTNDAIRRAQNYIDRQDTDGGKRVAFSSVADVDADNEHDEVKARCAGLKDKDQCLSARFSSGGFQEHDESECWHKQKDEAEAALQAIKVRRERAGCHARLFQRQLLWTSRHCTVDTAAQLYV